MQAEPCPLLRTLNMHLMPPQADRFTAQQLQAHTTAAQQRVEHELSQLQSPSRASSDLKTPMHAADCRSTSRLGPHLRASS